MLHRVHVRSVAVIGRPPCRRRFLRNAGFIAVAASVTTAFGQGDMSPPLLLMRFHAPNLGPSDAKVHIVEFLDPACEGCRAFYPVVKQIMDEHKGKVRLWVRYVPFHRGADFVVRALEAARAQGRYWEALDAIFAKQNEWTRNHTAQPDLVFKALQGIGLDEARLRRDVASPEIAKVLDQDMADAKALKVLQTPTFFVNGRPLKDYGFDQLRALVRDEVKRQYP